MSTSRWCPPEAAQKAQARRPTRSRRRRRFSFAAAAVASTAVVADAWQCTPHFDIPGPGHWATDHNGISLQPTCMYPDGREHHVFVVGDWGGIVYAPGMNPIPADHRSARFKAHHRDFVDGADDVAQLKVAEQMKKMAADRRVDYVLNVGDNFYWGGVQVACGLPVTSHARTGQWGPIFEDIYKGPGLDGKPWLGVLGNHDYGGYVFNQGWDQSIAYTWATAEVGSTGRWITPAQYWHAKVEYVDFSVDYFFIDSNVFDAYDPHADPAHNICSFEMNQYASCGPMGPVSVWDCPGWFSKLWAQEMLWLEDGLNKSTADWQIIVTHFPPDWGLDEWSYLTKKYGIDVFISGHKHVQTAYGPNDPWNLLPGTTVLVSGGGGGITSESLPDADGHDDMYGFMDMTLTKDYIQIDAISHGGELRTRTKMTPRPRNYHHPSTVTAEARLDSIQLGKEVATGANSTNGSNHSSIGNASHTSSHKSHGSQSSGHGNATAAHSHPSVKKDDHNGGENTTTKPAGKASAVTTTAAAKSTSAATTKAEATSSGPASNISAASSTTTAAAAASTTTGAANTTDAADVTGTANVTEALTSATTAGPEEVVDPLLAMALGAAAVRAQEQQASGAGEAVRLV